ncbi:cyclic AMP-dependent transcription factor ATF-6 alpha-like isoform X2 [Tigriopus californicus]|uniref:cyclic AMP-dependent transcription factor ATF-6 alpha-like isoform X2 n=1 Tax=Tigriopus californicus TaxID=6832 RepID=UPI0027DA8C53|nr:cyclic AMP-dependent transcription factor ATF-6 alpha-like isoform X2 [Tigriopus californicus]
MRDFLDPTQLSSDDSVNYANETMTESEDLLSQISNDLGLPDFMENHLFSNDLLHTPSLGEDVHNPDISLFSELMQDDMSLTDSSSLKSEPLSPSSPSSSSCSSTNHHHMPPSPSNSDHSEKDLSMKVFTTRTSDTPRIVGQYSPLKTNSNANFILSPPHSPPENCISTTTPNWQPMIQVVSTSGNFVSNHNQAPTIMTMTGLTNVKLPIPKVQRPAAQTPNVTKSPVVLTSSQFTQLTETGVIHLSGNSSNPGLRNSTDGTPIFIKTEPILSTNTPIVTASCNFSPSQSLTLTLPTTTPNPTSQSHHNDVELKALKRQQRMIKNRESACMSRKKKKEYVTNLEDQLKLLAHENRDLKTENEQLRSKLRELESEKTIWMDTVLTSPNLKKGTALFALLFMVSLNVSSLSGLYSQSTSPLSPMPNPELPVLKSNAGLKQNLAAVGGRSLLWAQEDLSEDNITKASPICPMFINQTESLRLDNQLRGWFTEDPTNDAKKPAAEQHHSGTFGEILPSKEQAPQNAETSLGHVQPVASGLSGRVYHMMLTEEAKVSQRPTPTSSNVMTPRGKAEITIYDSDTPRFSYESFFEAIDRRSDTFYVVSFSGDHLLLPATSHNQTNRPRMSLLLPTVAVPMNESMQPPLNHVAMMQIDCEVMNTKLLHIREDAVPVHMSAHLKNASIQRNGSLDAEEDDDAHAFNVDQEIHSNASLHHIDDQFEANNALTEDDYKLRPLRKKRGAKSGKSSSSSGHQTPLYRRKRAGGFR